MSTGATGSTYDVYDSLSHIPSTELFDHILFVGKDLTKFVNYRDYSHSSIWSANDLFNNKNIDGIFEYDGGYYEMLKCMIRVEGNLWKYIYQKRIKGNVVDRIEAMVNVKDKTIEIIDNDTTSSISNSTYNGAIVGLGSYRFCELDNNYTVVDSMSSGMFDSVLSFLRLR